MKVKPPVPNELISLIDEYENKYLQRFSDVIRFIEGKTYIREIRECEIGPISRRDYPDYDFFLLSDRSILAVKLDRGWQTDISGEDASVSYFGFTPYD